MKTSNLFTELAHFADILVKNDSNHLSAARKEVLLRMVNYLKIKLEEDGVAHLNFICTHNSRRSHIAQLWAAAAASHYGVSGIETYSGGTEVTAFQPRAIAALKRAGFQISTEDDSVDNPVYSVRFSEQTPPVNAWSKRFDDPTSPTIDFAAIMTCSDADQNCPFVPGTTLRLALTFEDPKVSDGTSFESLRYDQCVREIGLELLWAMRELSLRPF